MATKDNAKLEDLFQQVMVELGLDIKHADMKDTPRRLAKMYRSELFSGLNDPDFKFTVFPNEKKYDQLIITKDISFYSVCAHHWVPFYGTAAIGYIPGSKIVGLSKLARVLKHFARRPQVQENLTTQVTEFLKKELDAEGVMVVIKAEHLCMSARGVENPNHETITSCIRGNIDKMEFLELCK